MRTPGPFNSEYEGFSVSLTDKAVGIITFTRPDRLNAMSHGTRRDFCDLLTLAQFDDAVRVVVMTGEGRGFIAGVSNRGDEPPKSVPAVPAARKSPVNQYARLNHFAQEPARLIRRLDKPVIVAVNGFAIQLGLSLALAADYAYAARSARFGSATLRMGFMPDEGGHWLLVERLGARRALQFMLENRIVDADEAQQLGFVDEVVDDDKLLPRALETASRLATGPQVAQRLLKRATYNAAHQTLAEAGDDIAVRTAVSDFHPDAHEGYAAFTEKRPPTFNSWLDDGPGSHKQEKQ